MREGVPEGGGVVFEHIRFEYLWQRIERKKPGPVVFKIQRNGPFSNSVQKMCAVQIAANRIIVLDAGIFGDRDHLQPKFFVKLADDGFLGSVGVLNRAPWHMPAPRRDRFCQTSPAKQYFIFRRRDDSRNDDTRNTVLPGSRNKIKFHVRTNDRNTMVFPGYRAGAAIT
jgi:hypothetical protein